MTELKYDRNARSSRCYDMDVPQGTDSRRFGFYDRLGREIGGSVRKFKATFLPLPEGAEVRSWNCIQPGTHFGFRPHATRNGKSYGALQSERWFTTAEARDAAADKYFTDAAKRAAKRAGK